MLEMKPRDKKAPCKRWVIELEATTPSSVSSGDFLIAASRPGSRGGLRPSPPSASSAGGIQLQRLSLEITACMPSLESSAEYLITPLSAIGQQHRRGLASVNAQTSFSRSFSRSFQRPSGFLSLFNSASSYHASCQCPASWSPSASLCYEQCLGEVGPT